MAKRTFLADLVNPEVLADMVSGKLEEAIKFRPLATIGRTLQGRPGNTITFPKYGFIGLAEDVAEGEAIPIEKLSTTDTDVTVKKAGKGVEITDEAMLSGYGDPMGEAEKQLRLSIAGKIDNDVIAAAMTAPFVSGTGIADLSVDAIADALVYFGEDIDGPMVLFIAPAQLAALRKSEEFIRATDLGDSILMTGVVGAVLGCQIVVSAKVKAVDGKYTNFIVKPGAFTIEMKRDVEAEADRDIVTKTTVITIDQHYVAFLADDSKVIKVVTKA